MIVFPNAKINLGLYVIAKRANGYHNLETVFVPIPKLCDVLEVINAPEGAKEDCFSQTGIIIDGSPGDNLCLKALRLMREYCTIPLLNIILHKVIPTGAGLGGGSSDAAFMLKLLNEGFNAGLNTEELENIASEIGADCAFFIRNKATFGEGIGNKFSSVNINLLNLWIELVIPPIHVSTAFAYRNITPQQPASDLRQSVQYSIKMWRHKILNDFEKPVFEKYPEIEKIKDRFFKNGALYASMSGSGSAVFGLFCKKPEISWDENYFVFSGKLDVEK
ncbi:MAG: 4-(cytidine 5'-diphospho)-2-C-methyl-D-erythritol kinase [Cytophagaceae bacterium]|jgi:4-diphosphocytidyl-2-C-methyl-D-erythritol kinase|nr:4-(cytidine 5'-diphospho)-2-C-methyl-D-erythritol kinase [Cytophagaceae bacterium]